MPLNVVSIGSAVRQYGLIRPPFVVVRTPRPSGTTARLSHESCTVRPVLVPPCSVSPLLRRACAVTSNPSQYLLYLPYEFAAFWTLLGTTSDAACVML